MLDAKRDLKDIFIDGSLTIRRTNARESQPAEGSLCYIWNDAFGELKEILAKGKNWVHGVHGYSNSNYIKLTDDAYNVCECNTIIVGPNTSTKTQTIRIISFENETTRILFNGWGSSNVLFWEGPTSELIEYFKESQIW